MSGMSLDRLLICLVLLCGASFLAPAAAEAQSPRRVALVIGNAAYADSPLRNPGNDAQDMSAKLRQLGFEVTALTDRNRSQMTSAIRDFGRRAAGADAALFYFAGHGIAVRGKNYLLPVGQSFADEAEVETEAVEVNSVLARLEEAGARVSLLILDACRNNPLPPTSRSSSRGLARMEAPSGALVAFAAQPGAVAKDGTGRNGTFTKHLLNYIGTPGLPVEQVFKRVRAAVEQETGRAQSPREESSLTADFYFAQPGRASVTPEPVVPPALPGQSGGLSLDDLKKEEAARQQWSQWQARMKADFDAAAGFSGSADLQAKAWERFLAGWAQDNPYSQDDESLRQQAQQRRDQAQARARYDAQRLAQTVPVPQPIEAPVGNALTFSVNGVSFRMVSIPAGSFLMGSPVSEPGRDADEGPQRRVSLAAFLLGQTEVTQGLWYAVMGRSPSHFKDCGSACPVESVSWNEIQTFIQKLNQQTGQRFRLPSEAEWEYAARAGCSTPFNVGGQCRRKIEASEANFQGDLTYNGSAKGEYRKKTTLTGSFAANSWGLYDMHGNVDEYVQDCHGKYSSAPNNGEAVNSPSCFLWVFRGGSWGSKPLYLRSANRGWGGQYSSTTGFRLAMTAS
jgi:formylglycine-generating enzyme required for sulfatase activity